MIHFQHLDLKIIQLNTDLVPYILLFYMIYIKNDINETLNLINILKNYLIIFMIY